HRECDLARIMPQRGSEIAGSFGDILSGGFTPFAGGHWLAYKKSARFALHIEKDFYEKRKADSQRHGGCHKH
ncbi:hypothetical protein, partial [Serratia marcescens]